MFSSRNIESPNPFRPAIQYLLSSTKTLSRQRRRSSSGSIDSERKDHMMGASDRSPSTEIQNPSIPLGNLHALPPFREQQSGPNVPYASSDTDDDEWGDRPYTSTGLLYPREHGGKLTGWRHLPHGGGVGQFLFTTPHGWHIYIGLLVIWLGGCEIGLTIMNRIILWSGYLKENYTGHTNLMPLIAGVYKFPYPLTTALFEMLITHFLLILSAYLTRWISPWLNSAGLGGMVAPSQPISSSSPGLRLKENDSNLLRRLAYLTGMGCGGIAGGGLFEFSPPVVKEILPLAVIAVVKVLLSNISFAYAPFGLYLCFRIGILPLSLAFTSSMGQTSHSATSIISALAATIALLLTIVRTDYHFSWEAMVAGVLSAIFVAYYPISIQNTYKSLLTNLIPQGELLSSNRDPSNSPASSRAYWRLLHYTSLLSILITLPIVVLSGEVQTIYRNCYILDVFFHWEMVLCGGIGSWAVFIGTVGLTRATSPLIPAFLFVPCSAILVAVMARFHLPLYQWCAVLACGGFSVWFAWARKKEGRREGGFR